jgi:LmbE family N-acetylglucosaminyl deacetylase
VAYFLRLLDGNADDGGYPKTSAQSLKRLAAGQIATLSAIDGSTIYRSWDDLVAALRPILRDERTSRVQINVAELDAQINPNDHPDHMMTAKAALEASAGLAGARRVH